MSDALNIGFTAGPAQIQAARGLFSLQGTFPSFTLIQQPGGAFITWTPGLWMGSNNLLGNSSGWGPELTDLAASPAAWKGFYIYATWGNLENDAGTAYTFTNLDSIASQVAAMSPARHFMIQLNLGVFNASTLVPNGSSGLALPQYILTNSTYGNAITTGSGLTPTSPWLYGFYTGGNTGYWANFQNTNVMARITALINALGARYNANPLFDGVILCAWDAQGPSGGYTDAQYFGTQVTPATQGRELILSNLRTAFPNCNVCEQTGSNINGGTVTDAQAHLAWCVNNAFMPSASDSVGLTAWSADNSIAFLTSGNGQWSATPSGTSGTFASGQHWASQSGTFAMQFSTGQTVQATFTNGSGNVTWTPAVTGSPSTSGTLVQLAPAVFNTGTLAWFGLQATGSTWNPPNPSLMSLGSGFFVVQPPDITAEEASKGLPGSPYTPSDILNAFNQKYQNAYCIFTRLTSADTATTAAQWPNVVNALAAIGVTNTTYPSVYPVVIPSPPNTYNALTDTNIYNEPSPVPAFGPAGSIITDAVFGNRILRVTDGNSDPNFLNFSWRPNDGSAEARRWNATSTRFCITTNGNEAIYDFDAATFQASSHPIGGSFFITQASGANGIGTGTTGQWDAVSPDIFWGIDNSNNVSSYNIATSTLTSVWATSALPGGSSPGDLTVCLGNGLITIRLGPQDTATSCAAFLPSTSTQYVLNTSTGTMNGNPIQMYSNGSPVSWVSFPLHNVRCGNEGRYVILTAQGGIASSVAIWDIIGNTVAVVPQMQGHQVSAYGFLVNTSATSTLPDQAVIRGVTTQAAITTPSNLNNVPASDANTGDTDRYYSWCNGVSGRQVPVIKSGLDDTNSGNSPIAAPWQREIVALATNGSGITYRMCHHFSWFKNFEDGVHATVSPNGLYALFASNWATTLGTPDQSQGGTAGTFREDCFIVEMKGNG